MVFDERLIVPDADKSLDKGAVLPWRRGGKRMMVYYKSLLRGMAGQFGHSLETPWKDLPEDFKQKLLHGTGDENVEFTFWRAGNASKVRRPFEGVIPNLQRLYAESESEFTRNRLKGFMNPQPCDACGGRRLKPEILAVRLGVAPNPNHNPNLNLNPNSPPIAAPPATPLLPTKPMGRAGSPLPAAPGTPAPPSAAPSPNPSAPPVLPGLSIMDVCALSIARADDFFAEFEVD